MLLRDRGAALPVDQALDQMMDYEDYMEEEESEEEEDDSEERHRHHTAQLAGRHKPYYGYGYAFDNDDFF